MHSVKALATIHKVAVNVCPARIEVASIDKHRWPFLSTNVFYDFFYVGLRRVSA